MSPENHPMISPVFNHRLYSNYPTDLVNAGTSILFMTTRARSVLALIKTQFDTEAASQLDESTIYCSFECVQLEIKDIHSCNQSFIKSQREKTDKELAPAIKAAMHRIEKALSGARCVIYFLCEGFGNEGHELENTPVTDAIDFLIEQLTIIGEIARDFHATIEVVK